MRLRIAAWPVAMALLFVLGAKPQDREETEGLYDSVYRNCEHGWAVRLPPGVIAHGGDPRPAQHGFLISPPQPGTRKVLNLDAARLIDFYDDLDSTEIVSPRAYFDQYDKEAPDGITPVVRKIQETTFRGMPALYVRLSKAGPEHRDETEQIIAYHKPRGLGGIFYVLFLRSTPKDFANDHALFLKLQTGFRAYPERHGACPEVKH